ncbi:Transmembrane component Cce_1531 of energizing module of predicted ECF transporter [Crocosphaera watsonii WH 0402]|uniref:Transmembrane component Cce_1531 of energizing module of predicted ECF transporter n=1 Tax=Crocosphaera watsonii WH 0402 TaxID=1284629 RepID=T2JQX9_CROWT|nr:Transmembrane component Cce_1531 of energizing module of predicted ECF transporter [Crocosphaera watsonii WH 0402]
MKFETVDKQSIFTRLDFRTKTINDGNYYHHCFCLGKSSYWWTFNFTCW